MIKIGSLNIDKIYLGISDDVEVYLGTVKVWPEDVLNYKYKFTLTDDSVVSGACDASSAITTAETSAYTSTMKEAVISDCVASIGEYTFGDCTGLTSIDIPSGVTNIGGSAFYNCRNLTSMEIPSGVTRIGYETFRNCSSLTSIDIPSGVISIGVQAFYGCSGLTSCTIGSGVTSIGGSAFYNCRSLTSIDIPSGVTSIGYAAFNGCSGLTSITVEATTPPTLGTTVFDNTNNCSIYVPCESVEAYKSATNWSTYASRITCVQPSFSGKYKFTLTDDSVVSGECNSSSSITFDEISAYKATTKEAVIGDCVTSIGNDAFSNYSSLTSIDIPSGVTSIGGSVFNACTSLTSIDIPDSVTSIGGMVFFSCSSLTSVTIPNSVTEISNEAFKYCTNLIRLNSDVDGVFNIPSSVTRISYDAFYACRSLTSVNIPSGVTSIGGYAFYSCSGLTSIDLPDSVTSIGNFTFSNCSGLTSITVNATTPPTLGLDVFGNTNDCPIYVPSASVAAYKSANRWSSYASRIFAILSESCIDDSGGTWVTVDGDFNTAQAVYKLDFVGLHDAYVQGAPYASASLHLYDENQNYIGTVEASYDETSDLFNVTVSSGSPSTVIYDEDVEEVDICSLFSKPLYLGYVEGEPPAYEYCVDYECLQYCCNEWDEESGECIDYDYNCCEEIGECYQNEYIYLSSAFVENT